jgi:hypothetical protein
LAVAVAKERLDLPLEALSLVSKRYSGEPVERIGV